MKNQQSDHTACVYIRTAQSGATGHNTIENQVARTSAAAHKMGVSITDCYIDEGVSGLSQTRTALAEMMAVLRRQPTGWVIVASLDRLARSRLLSVQLERDIAATGASLVAADELAPPTLSTTLEVRIRSYIAILAAEQQDKRRRIGREKRHASR